MNVLNVGVSESSVCGVRDHARVLSSALRDIGLSVTSVWFDGGSDVSRTMTLGRDLLRHCQEVRPDAVLLHYSVFAFSHRGIPIRVAGLAFRLRRLGVPIVLFAHEFAYPWCRRGWRGAVQAVTQRVVLAPLLGACAAVVVTTPHRVEWLRTRCWLPRRPIVFAPVFSNIRPNRSSDPIVPVSGRVGLFSFGAEELSADVVTRAVAALAGRSPEVHLTLIGAPGPDSPAGDQWRRAANATCCRIAFTGIVEEAEVSRQLAACQVIVFADPAGPSSRKGSLMAALAHGRAVVAFDGPQGWRDLIEAGGIVVVAPETQALSAELGRLLGDDDARADLGRRGLAVYEAELAPERAALRVRDLLLETQMAR